MKPEDLRAPFAWNNRRVVVEDRIFYVPTRCETHTDFIFPGWNSPLFFNNDNPISIEYCSGNGGWIAEKAAAHPEMNWLAVEKKFTRVRKIWSKIKNSGLTNLIALCGEACFATRLFLPSNTLSQAYINFPDPWPKKRHAKHRLMRPEFIGQIQRILKPNSSLTLVTDDPVYSEQAIDELNRFPGFLSAFPDPHFITDLEGYGTSYFNELWKEKGRTIRYHSFRKVDLNG